MITWLASYPKSGNTWIRAFADAYLFDRPVDLNNIHSSESDANFKWFQTMSPVPMSMLDAPARLLFRTAGLFNLSMMNRPPFLVKTHNMYCSLYKIPMFPPNTIKQVIYVVRDPRDVAISLADHVGEDIDTAIELMGSDKFLLLGDFMPSMVGNWSTHIQTWKAAATVEKFPFTIIRYEDLLHQPVTTFTDILKAWGQPVDEARVRRAVKNTKFEVLQEAEDAIDGDFRDKSSHSDRFFRVGRSQWRDDLTKEQIQRIEGTHQDVMKELNYHLVFC